MRKTSFSAIITILLLSYFCQFSESLSSNKAPNIAYTELDSLWIDELEEYGISWKEAKNKNGFPGEGTSQDPYVLSNLRINGLVISDSSVKFEIRSCAFQNSKYASGISLINTSNGLITNNEILSNDGSGICLVVCDNIEINSNTIEENAHGIYLEMSSSIKISYNTIKNNDANGIEITEESTNLDVYSNNIYYNTKHGISVKDSDKNIIQKNAIGGNDKLGIYLYNSDSNSIKNNEVLANGNSIALVHNSKYNKVESNEMKNNGQGLPEEKIKVGIGTDCIGNIINGNTPDGTYEIQNEDIPYGSPTEETIVITIPYILIVIVIFSIIVLGIYASYRGIKFVLKRTFEIKPYDDEEIKDIINKLEWWQKYLVKILILRAGEIGKKGKYWYIEWIKNHPKDIKKKLGENKVGNIKPFGIYSNKIFEKINYHYIEKKNLSIRLRIKPQLTELVEIREFLKKFLRIKIKLKEKTVKPSLQFWKIDIIKTTIENDGELFEHKDNQDYYWYIEWFENYPSELTKKFDKKDKGTIIPPKNYNKEIFEKMYFWKIKEGKTRICLRIDGFLSEMCFFNEFKGILNLFKNI